MSQKPLNLVAGLYCMNNFKQNVLSEISFCELIVGNI